MNYYTDSPEWKFLFKNAIDWKTILPLYFPTFPTANGFNSNEELIQFFETLLETTGEWTGNTIRNRAGELDEVGCATLNRDGSVQLSEPTQKTYREAANLEVFGLTADSHFGGMGLPISVGMTMFGQLTRACISTSTQLGFFNGMADMIERFCDPETKERLIPKILKGELSGSMCLTEPDAGSDVGSLENIGRKAGQWQLCIEWNQDVHHQCGWGIWFHPGAGQGRSGWSCGYFTLLAEEKLNGKQNYRITKIEEKMGMHGSMTCEVVYENTVAQIVGQENEGFQHMLYLMNEARISVGIQSIGGIEAALERADRYASERKQFGRVLHDLPLFKRNFNDWKTEQDAFRALMVDTISSFDIFQKLDLKKRHGQEWTETEQKLFRHHQKIVRARTPLVKFYGAELYATLSIKAIQAFGGYGYMKEYDVERIHRDSFGALLYEGTSQIQSLMAMKDFVKKVMKNPSQFVQSMVASSPIGNITEKNEFKKTYLAYQYEFQKRFVKMLLSCFNPDAGFLDVITKANQYFSKEYWQDSEKLETLMTHAETLCQALSILETIKVLGVHAQKFKEIDPYRVELFDNYLKIAQPKLQAIYQDWDVRA